MTVIKNLTNLSVVFPYSRNGTKYYVILDPVFVFDRIPNYTENKSKGDILAEIAYVQINIISDYDLR